MPFVFMALVSKIAKEEKFHGVGAEKSITHRLRVKKIFYLWPLCAHTCLHIADISAPLPITPDTHTP